MSQCEGQWTDDFADGFGHVYLYVVICMVGHTGKTVRESAMTSRLAIDTIT